MATMLSADDIPGGAPERRPAVRWPVFLALLAVALLPLAGAAAVLVLHLMGSGAAGAAGGCGGG
jgi:hypothetical protein